LDSHFYLKNITGCFYADFTKAPKAAQTFRDRSKQVGDSLGGCK